MSENMELRHLRYFVAVADAGSLTVAAGRKLHTSQPSLSRQIRDLEEEVDAQLLTRGARGIELTEAGRAFLDHARLVLSQVEAATDAARGIAHPAKPRFVMGFLTNHELTWMPEAFRILREELPNIDVTISSQYSPALADALLKGTVDAAFSSTGTRVPGVGVPSSHQGTLACVLAQRPPSRCAQSNPRGGLSGRGICHGVAHGCSRTARSHRQLPEAVRNPYHANSRDRPRLYRYKTIQLQTERFGLNSIDARRRAITCLHRELSHSVCHESSSQGRPADYRPGAWVQKIEQVSDLEATTFTIG
jgi:DNA-binding transcriptional LysR family regulator